MMDGLTTNGVLILHPLSGQHGVVSYGPGVWREVSIAGDIYGLRKARSDRGAGKMVGLLLVVRTSPDILLRTSLLF